MWGVLLGNGLNGCDEIMDWFLDRLGLKIGRDVSITGLSRDCSKAESVFLRYAHMMMGLEYSIRPTTRSIDVPFSGRQAQMNSKRVMDIALPPIPNGCGRMTECPESGYSSNTRKVTPAHRLQEFKPTHLYY